MLTPAQRFHFDVNGFVVVPNLFPPDTVAAAKAVLDRMLTDDQLEEHRAYVRVRRDHHMHFGPMIEYDPALLDIAADDKSLPIPEYLVGGEVRLGATEAIVNRRPADFDPNAPVTRQYHPTGFHRGISPEVSTFQRDGKCHYLWVKTLMLLTDVGPDDGGTVMVRGSHRLPHPVKDVNAWWDDSLVGHAEGTAGSVLFMSEATIHSTAVIRSDKTRYILINGYTPPWTQAWPQYDPSPDFVAKQTPAMRRFLLGESRYSWGVR